MSWHLLHSPHALWARVLKCIYFPHSSLLDDHFPRLDFWVWRIILAGRVTINQHVIWWLGNGWSSHVWNSNWASFSSELQQYCSNSVTMKADLIHHDHPHWNLGVLHNLILQP